MRSIIIRRIILSFVVVFLFLPSFAYTQLNPEELVKKQDIVELKKKESELILDSLRKYIKDEWVEKIVYGDEFNSMDHIVLAISLKSMEIHTLRYLLYDVGGDVLKETLEVAYLLLAQDPKLFIEKFEDYTVDKAKEYATDWLLQKELKIGKGNLNYAYPAFGGGWEAGKFPYIIVYRPIDLERGEVAIGIYSSKTIKTPEVTLDYQWEGGIYELPPFKVEIKGEVKEISGRYIWTKGPEIEIIFDENVPEFEFKEPSVWDKVESSFNKVRNVVGKAFGVGISGVEAIAETIKNMWSNLKDFVSGIDPYKASVIPEIEVVEQDLVFAEDFDVVKKEMKHAEEIVEMNGKGGSEANEQEIQEILDDIAERIDILAQQVGSLLPEEPTFAEATVGGGEYELGIMNYEENEENEEEVIEEPEPEEVEETEEEIVVVVRRSRGSSSNPDPEPSYCPLVNLGDPVKDRVIFDEIGWMGTDVSSNDEWIKLKNITDSSIDLSDWQVLDIGEQIKVILTGQIDDFYLLERTDDTSLPDVTADIIYTGALNNTDEVIYLFDGNCVLRDKWETPVLEPEPEPELDPDPILEVSPDNLEFNIIEGDNSSEEQILDIEGVLNWDADFYYTSVASKSWLSLEEKSDLIVSLESNVSSLEAGTYTARIVIDAGEIEGSPYEVDIELNVEGIEPEPEPEDPSQNVIINEIAWMGTEAYFGDEWIELYNPSDESINLLGWRLIFTSTNGIERITNFDLIGSATPVIDGLSYFLLERNDRAIKDIKADHILNGALNNDGGIFELKNDENNLIDKVNFSGEWSAGNNDKKISMERDIGGTWRNNNLIIRNGQDDDGNNIWGTPRTENSVVQETLIIGSSPFPYNEFDEITLGVQSGKYVVRLNIKVPENKTLIVDPGVVVAFYDRWSEFVVEGTLMAIGEEDNKITFTSVKDVPYPGAWGGIYFKGAGANGSEISNAIFRYAGGDDYDGRTAVHVEGSSVNIKDSLFEHNMSSSIYLIDSDSIVDNVQVINTKPHHVNYGSNGIIINGGSPVIKNSLVKQNEDGITTGIKVGGDSLASIENNTFEGNTNAMYLSDSSLYVSGNSAINNEIDGVMVMGNFLEDAIWQADLPYVPRSNINFFPDKTITLEPGVVVKFYDEYSGFSIPGTLKAIGTESDKITFTSLEDEPNPGDWGKISLKPGSSADLDNIILEYGGGGTFGWAGIEADQAELSLKNSIVRFNKNAGISLINNATAIFDGIQFNDNKCNISKDDKCINP